MKLLEACHRALAYIECLPESVYSLDQQETREQLEQAIREAEATKPLAVLHARELIDAGHLDIEVINRHTAIKRGVRK